MKALDSVRRRQTRTQRGDASPAALPSPIRTRLAENGRRASVCSRSSPASSRRWSAARRSAWRASSIGRSRSATTWTRRSSSSQGCRASSPGRSSAPRWPQPASSFRRCCATRSPRRSRLASRRVRRSAPCWRSSSARRSAPGRSRRYRWPVSPVPRSPRRSSTGWRRCRTARCRRRCCCSPA